MVDGAKLFELANSFGRNVQLGTENNRLKIVITWTRETERKRYEVAEELIKKLANVNRDT